MKRRVIHSRFDCDTYSQNDNHHPLSTVSICRTQVILIFAVTKEILKSRTESCLRATRKKPEHFVFQQLDSENLNDVNLSQVRQINFYKILKFRYFAHVPQNSSSSLENSVATHGTAFLVGPTEMPESSMLCKLIRQHGLF